MKIPEQYLPVMPYLIVHNAAGFVKFMQNVFGATLQLVVPREENIIMHGELRINDAVIMFADATEQFAERTAGMFIYVPGVDTVYTAAVNQGAKNLRQPGRENYGYTAGFEDPYGNQWWIVEPER
jgi:PhnB protein